MQRPTAVTAFGVLNIVFAIWGFVGLIASLAMFKMGVMAGNPMLKLMNDNPGYALWIKVSIPLGFAGSVVLMAAGIGLLKMKSWARKLSIGYGTYLIAAQLVGGIVTYRYLVRPMIEQASRSSGAASAGAIGGAIGGMIGTVFGMIYPVLLIVFMTRPKVVAAFFPPQYPNYPPGAPQA